MQDYFYELADHLQSLMRGNEVWTASYHAEDSDFVRFNHNKVRQAGSVVQREITVDLIQGQRHAAASTTLCGDLEIDRPRVRRMVEDQRELVPHVSEDPYLLYSTEVRSSERIDRSNLPARDQAVRSVMQAGEGKDLVGIYAAGGIHAGFANSMGQRNWFTAFSFNLDWSLYHSTDKAVKSGYAGFTWSDADLSARMGAASEQLAILARSPRTIDPGKYRVYLSPVALYEILSTVSWGGFGLKDHRTKQTSLLKMAEGGATLHPSVMITENTAEGIAPDFQGQGFIRPGKVELISQGCFRNCLASPRSAKEYGVPTNGASGDESPQSIDMGAGQVPRAEVLRELGTGLYINNLWYLNYSDRPACRMTGMTRFATLWVENGQVVAPVNVMRFDESLYRILGQNLVGLTAERDLILDSETYGKRSTRSARVPGAVVDEFAFTL
ncbi:MAG: metallopeptidase TldD-related protein [Candidatus Eisenbacteria bacterium]|uniref:TldE/PmbA family protein n=1 Tax=Eiseniibacteriota bacterium TaxID=2212470 RepID=A0A956M3F2_UNCEI|nr:TldE/PmbA family protein [Candidatus Eisenbacteria bacterium]